MAITHAIQAWDDAGRATVGYDNPTMFLEVYTTSAAKHPPQVGTNWYNPGNGVRSFTLSSDATRIAVCACGTTFYVFEVY